MTNAKNKKTVKSKLLTYVVNMFSQSHCFERFLVVYTAGRSPRANQMAKFRSISEIINPLPNEAQFFTKKHGFFRLTKKHGFFRLTKKHGFF